ncbi:BGTF surface domain-containing protein [Halohasta salina]|uniref:BGTF surface domain-containing protein n=1 Tax=Halohasta salina TaxID=2961621 RepID=UPI0020A54002|nr:BGTF surface domain-containing protein [Halohasta salina]
MGDSAYLVEVQRDAGNIDGQRLVSTLNPETNDGTNTFYEVDTDSLEPGTEYGISNTTSYQSGTTLITQTFSVISEGFGVAFDDDSVDETDSESTVELDSDRQTTSYNVTVSVDGPDDFDADMIEELFNATNGTGATVTDSDYLPLDHLGYDRDEGDGINELRDDGYVTLDLSYLEANNGTISGEDVTMDFEALADGEGLPDGGEYEFEFIVTDTGATATDTISIAESDEGAGFSSGTYQAAAGDITTFEFELEDTDETWIQIGDADSDFVDVLYIEADDEAEPIEVKVNTRLLGTSTSLDGEAVYDVENADIVESAYHDANGGTMTNTPNGVTLFEDDGSNTNNSLDSYVNDLGIADTATEQLTRPLQATTYELQIAGTDVDNALFDADLGAGEANDQLDSAVIELENPEIGDITIHAAPGENADDETEIADLVEAATPRDEIALDDRLIVQVEATGLYGALVAGAENENAADPNWDRLEDGVSTQVLYNLIETTNESIDFEISAEETTGNQDPLEVDLESGDTDSYIVIDNDGGQFFVVVDTSSDTAFANGDAPDDDLGFTALLEYDADNDDDRYEFDSDSDPDPFSAADDAVNYPYLLQGDVLSNSVEFDLAPAAISFDNLNADDVLEIENVEDADISGTTNVAPGSDATLRVSSTDASNSFRIGQDVTIDDDGSLTAEFDFSEQSVGDAFDTTYRVGGSTIDTVDSVLVEAGTLGGDLPDEGDDTEDDPEDEPTDDTPEDDVDEEETDDGSTDEETDDETPGFGVIVALIAVLAAALLAVRRNE